MNQRKPAGRAPWRARPAAAALCALASVATLAAPAGPRVALAAPPPPTPIFADTSAGPEPCMASNPRTVGYRPDRIVVRPPIGMSDATVINKVQAALAAIGYPAVVGPLETILMPPPPPVAPLASRRAGSRTAASGSDDGSVKIVSVTLSVPNPESPKIVKLARKLRLPPSNLPASPDYEMEPSSGPIGMWPQGPPRPTGGPTPPRTATLGAGVTVALYDTGMGPTNQSNQPPNISKLTPADVETIDGNGDGVVDLYYGNHAPAIGGVFATLAPAATVKVSRMTEPDGLATDISATRRMASTLRAANDHDAWPDIIVNAFGSPACETGTGADLAPLGLEAVAEAVEVHDQALIVASAGNENTSRPYYPAAFPGVVAVGAVDTSGDADLNPWTSASRSGPRASFSNYGTWVDAFGSGVNLPTWHVTGLRFEPNGPVFGGYGNVDGSSFSGPEVAALIAERMATSGKDADGAWADVQASGTKCSTANGGGVALALTSMTASATTPKPKTTPSQC
jgi:hypothetical protein